MNLDQPLFTTIYCRSEEFIALCMQNKIVQCLICEQCISIIFVFFTCTEIKTVHVLLTVITHGRGLLHLICQEENSDDFFLCNYLYHPVYVRFILKVSRVDFLFLLKAFPLKC